MTPPRRLEGATASFTTNYANDANGIVGRDASLRRSGCLVLCSRGRAEDLFDRMNRISEREGFSHGDTETQRGEYPMGEGTNRAMKTMETTAVTWPRLTRSEQGI